MEEESWKRDHGGAIMEEESWRRHPGGAQEAPRTHPGGPKRHPGGSQEAPRRHPGGIKRHPGHPRGSKGFPDAEIDTHLSQNAKAALFCLFDYEFVGVGVTNHRFLLGK